MRKSTKTSTGTGVPAEHRSTVPSRLRALVNQGSVALPEIQQQLLIEAAAEIEGAEEAFAVIVQRNSMLRARVAQLENSVRIMQTLIPANQPT
ncbi:hypothetical protein [Herbaspirillum huttiense]|uniref:hypothetical protein n=1 Tax=Herbaspirillum huttiense TaxID=863372 RepID=UPI0039AEA4C7